MKPRAFEVIIPPIWWLESSQGKSHGITISGRSEKRLQSVTTPEQACYQIWLLKVLTRQAADTQSLRTQIWYAGAKLFSPILLLAPLLLISVKSWKRLDAAGRGLWEFFHHSDVVIFPPCSLPLGGKAEADLQNIPAYMSISGGSYLRE